jgi:hypothetical protein
MFRYFLLKLRNQLGFFLVIIFSLLIGQCNSSLDSSWLDECTNSMPADLALDHHSDLSSCSNPVKLWAESSGLKLWPLVCQILAINLPLPLLVLWLVCLPAYAPLGRHQRQPLNFYHRIIMLYL